AAQAQAGWTPMIPSPSVDFGIAKADVVSRASVRGTLEPEHLVDQDDSDAPRGDLPVDDDYFVHRAADAICGLGASIFEPPRVFIDAEETFLEVSNDLLRPHDENDSSGPADIRSKLAATHGSREERPDLGDSVYATELHLQIRAAATELVALGLAIHAPDATAD